MRVLAAGAARPAENPTPRMGFSWYHRRVAIDGDLAARLDAATRALRESEERYRALLAGVTDVVMRFARDGRHLFVSENVEAVTGIPRARFLGATHRELGFPDDLSDFWEATIRRVFDTDQPLETEFTVHGQRGSQVFGWRLVPEHDAEGRVCSVLTLSPDVTSQRQVQRDYQNLLGNMFNGLAIGEVVCDDAHSGRDLRVLSVNPAFERMTGLKASEIVGTSARAHLPGVEERWFEAMVRVALEGQPLFIEDFRTPRGRHFEVSAFMTVPGQFACVLSDITERTRAEEALRQGEERWRSYVLAAPYGVFVVDREGHHLDVNPAACAITGYERDELLAMRVIDILPADAVEAGAAHFRHVVETGRAIDAVAVQRKDGTRRWTNISAVRLNDDRFLGFVEDITERKQADERLEMTKQTYVDVFNAISESIYIQDEHGTFLDVNGGAARMYRMSREELIGQSPLTVAAPGMNDLEAIRRASEEVARTGVPARFDFWAVRRGGEVFPKEVVVHRGRYFSRDVLIATARDVTDKHRVEAERERLREQLLQAQKMESVGRLAGGVAHDFNNMLGLILGHAEMALERVAPDSDLHADLVEVRTAAERSADLTRQLLAFARKQTVAPQVLDVNATVEGMLKMLRRLIGEDIELVWRPGDDVGAVLVDPSQLDQVLANLCLNARDAITGFGTVTIATSRVSVDAATCARHAGTMPGTFVRLAVRDSGCGMGPDVVAHLFEPFFTTKALGKGTGLGLATVYGIVTQNSGFVEVASAPGQGSTLDVFLPCHAATGAVRQRPDMAPPTARGHETILLVEDEPSILEMIRRMLARQGYAVLAAATPAVAVQLAREHAGTIHLLVTDVVMPEMNGRELARTILTLHPDVERLFMSGYTADVIAHHGVLNEGLHFIQKPFTMKALAAKVRSVLDR
jgi:two-component system cell cycle sensor histidine kinase/response regulator CckA